MNRITRSVAIACTAAAVLLGARGASAQDGLWELGLDAGLTFGLGDRSSIQLQVPASRFRAGWFLAGGSWSVEPAVGLGLVKVEDIDAVFSYDIEVGALYHFKPFVAVSQGTTSVMTRENAAYVRPFVGLNGVSGPGDDVNEFSLGAGLGLKVPWRESLGWRFEGNLGYGFDNEAFRLGLLAGVSFFTR